jgi:predicted RNase H-like nuclease (RuvC/YqgF family)
MNEDEFKREIDSVKTSIVEMSHRLYKLESESDRHVDKVREVSGFQREFQKEVQNNIKDLSLEIKILNEKVATEIAGMHGILKGMSIAYKVIGGIAALSLGVVALMFFKLVGAA